jgi:dTDP-glucose pyrophosphorylase
MNDQRRDDHPDRWKSSLVPPTATVAEVIRNLNETTLQIALVVSPDGTLLGTVTDGDIRRGLLRGFDLTSPIPLVMHRDPIVMPYSLGRDMVLKLMQANKIQQMPVVDEQRRVVGLHLWNELLEPRERANLMVLMAGGQGTRLRPHTANCPKALLPVAGKPMLEHIIGRARSEGFKRFVIVVHYLGHMIEEYFGNGTRWNVQIDYVREESPLGTAGGIGLLTPTPDAAFIVSNADMLTDIRYGELLEFHSRHGAAATMAVRRHEWQHPFGVVLTRGVDIVGFEEKPITRSHINAGIYVLEPEALACISPGESCDMPTIFARLQERSARTIIFPMYEPWLDVGGIDEFQRVQTTETVDRPDQVRHE